ncbi:type IV secretion system protein [Ehrlichia sp. JZT12]
MIRVVLVISILLLSSCGYHGCIKPKHVLFDEDSSAVMAGLKEGETNHVAWVKSDLVLAGYKSLTFSVDTVDVNFCSNTKKIINVFSGDGNTKESKEFELNFPNIMAGEKLTFRLSPAFEFTVDKNVCENNNARVYVQNVDKCMKNYLDEHYAILTDNYDFQMNNIMYLEDANYSTAVDQKREWINFPAKIIYHMDSKSYNDFIKKIDDKNSQENAQFKEEMFYLCATGKDLEDRALESADKQIEEKNGRGQQSSGEKEKLTLQIKKDLLEKQSNIRKKYSKQYEAYAINMICGNLCNIPGYIGQEKRSENCFVTEEYKIPDNCSADNFAACTKNVKDSVTTLPFVYLKHKSNSGGSSASDVALLTNHAYSFSNAVPDKDLYLELRPPAGKRLTGQYKIEVIKDCSNHVKDSLYYIVSKGVPKVQPGDGDSKKIDFVDNEDVVITLTDKDRAGELYFGVKDNGDGYNNNTGYFKVLITAKKKIPNIISYMVEQLKASLERGLYGTSDTNSGGVHVIYNSIIKNTHFIRIANALLVLYVLIHALFYCVGFSRASIFDLLVMTLKISVIIYVIGPNSWEFFNDHLFKLFTEAPVQLIAIMTGQDSGKSTSFEFLDLMLYRFSLSDTWLQILALLFTGPVGWISVTLIFWGLIVLFLTIATAVITYLISIILIGLLLSIAPFFIICILFKRTKAIFDAWVKSLVQTAMQPVIIFASFALLTQVIDSVIYAMFNFESCDSCVIQPVFDLGIMKINICLLEFLLPLGFSPISTFSDNIRDAVNSGPLVFVGLPMPIVKILIFVIVVNATKHFIGSSGEMCTSIFGSFANLSMVAENAKESALGIIGMDQNSRMQRARYEQMSNLNNQSSDGERRRGSFDSQLPIDSNTRQSRSGISIPENPPSSFGG